MQASLPSNVKNPAPTLKLDGNGAWWCDPQDYSGFGLKSQTPTPKLAARAPARAALHSYQGARTLVHRGHLEGRHLPQVVEGDLDLSLRPFAAEATFQVLGSTFGMSER
jgi:hypothetical protein